jgi:hypothetical protein
MKAQIEIAFYRGSGRVLDKVIRWWTRSQFSHVEIVISRDGDKAVLFSASARDGGVRKATREWVPEQWEVVSVRHRISPLDLALFMRDEIGAGYDYAGLFGSQLFASGWQSKRRWFCSEICAAILGLPEPQRYSPESLRKMVLFLNERGVT